MKTLVSSLICVIWTMAVAAAQSPSPATGNFRIAGVVVHSLTGQPLPGIQMSILRAQTPDVLQTVVAADRGHFTFQVSDPGKYVLVAQGRGFPRQAWDEHNGFSTAAVVGPGKDSENIVFRVATRSLRLRHRHRRGRRTGAGGAGHVVPPRRGRRE